MAVLSVTRNTSYLTLSYVWQKLLAFVYFVLVARFIGVADLGKYTFALSFTALFAVLVDLGFTSAIIRESAKFKEKSEQYLGSVLAIKLLTCLGVYGIIVVVINVLGYPALTKHLVYLSGLVMLLDQFTISFWGVFRGWRNLKYESLSIAINQVIILAIGTVVLWQRWPLLFLMVPFLVGSLFNLIYSGASVKFKLKINLKLIWNKEVLKFLLKISIPFALIAVFSRVYGYIDTIMLSKLIGDTAVGWYSVAMKIPFAFQFIPAAMAAAIFPAFSHDFQHNLPQLKATFERVIKALTWMVAPISVGILLLARPIIQVFFGAQYLPAVPPLQILMLGLFFVFLNFPLGALLNGCNKQGKNAWLVGTAMVLNVVLNIILIPSYSFIGASIAFLASHGFLFMASLWVANGIVKYNKRGLLWMFGKTVLSVLLMATVVYYLQPIIPLIPLVILAGIVYVAVLFLVRGITREELTVFRQMFKRRSKPETESL